MLSCRDASELATDYEEGALTPREQLSMRVHLFLCRMCRNYLDQLRKTRQMLAGRVMDGPTPELEDHILTALRGAQKPPAE